MIFHHQAFISYPIEVHHNSLLYAQCRARTDITENYSTWISIEFEFIILYWLSSITNKIWKDWEWIWMDRYTYSYMNMLKWMDTHRLLYQWTDHWRFVKRCQYHNEPPTPYKIKVNNCKLTDLVIRIELTWAILMPRFSNFQRNSTIHFTCFYIW